MISDLKYCKFSFQELKDVFSICASLALMFSILFVRFAKNANDTFIGIFLDFLIFFIVLFLTRGFIMKLTAMRDGFELIFKQAYFKNFGLRPYDNLNYWSVLIQKNIRSVFKTLYNRLTNKKEHVFRKAFFYISGIPMTIVSLFLYAVSFGFFVYPDLWNYQTKRIEHRFANTQQRYEMESRFFLYSVEISDYRISKSIMVGFIFYFVFGLLVKTFFLTSDLYLWFLLALYWIAFVTFIPIPSSEGFELFRRNLFAWFLTLSMLIVGMLSLLVFSNKKFIILVFVFTGLVMFFYKVWEGAWTKYPYGRKELIR